jgi:hypothetical protein
VAAYVVNPRAWLDLKERYRGDTYLRVKKSQKLERHLTKRLNINLAECFEVYFPIEPAVAVKVWNISLVKISRIAMTMHRWNLLSHDKI